jgi:hypothetical protein
LVEREAKAERSAATFRLDYIEPDPVAIGDFLDDG